MLSFKSYIPSQPFYIALQAPYATLNLHGLTLILATFIESDSHIHVHVRVDLCFCTTALFYVCSKQLIVCDFFNAYTIAFC